MTGDITSALAVLIPAVFAALGLVLVAKVNKTPTPKDVDEGAAVRMEALVDRLQAELDRRDQHSTEQDAELRRLRSEVDVLHRLVSACYRILWENNLEPPKPDPGP